MEYNKLSTGETYKLADLFSKDNKIIIPDLQRDYCWGTTFDKDGKNLVERFIENITDNQGKELNLGLLYGYEAPLGHIQLCDGQQRITTLFLLLGMLNRKTNDAFRRLLISETEENDDWEPYLQYAIRESSLYFLSDLTRFFFIENKDVTVSDIRQQSWYFKDYDLDPSIQSMIAAMEKIETIINKKNIVCATFGKYIIENLSFLYYDMENRTKGEETFVIINTTGEPLSATQSLKPLLIDRQAKEEQDVCAQNWEKWEQFFWKNKGKNDTADNGLKEFFRWIMLLNLDAESDEFKHIQKDGTYKFDLENIEFDKINKYFKIISERLFGGKNTLFPNNKDWLSPDIDGNSQVVWFRLLTVLEYINRFPDANNIEIWRVRMFFRNLSLVPNITKAISEVLPEAIRVIKEMPNTDICSVLDLENVSKSLLTEETKIKLGIYRNAENREEVEKAFWAEEDCKLWSGEILPMIEWATTNGEFDYNLFKTYRDKFAKVFHDDLEYKELDITRRALLTCNLKGYPRIFKGYTNWSFAWYYEDWKALINDNIGEFKSFLDKLYADDIYKAQNEMIDNFSSKKYDEFVKIPELLGYCEQKKIQWWGDELGWTLIKGDRASGEYANLKSYRLYLELKTKIPDDNVRFSSGNKCAVIDENKEHSGWAIAAWHTGNDKYSINLFRRKGETENTFGELPSVFELQWNGERYEKTYMDTETTVGVIINLIDKL